MDTATRRRLLDEFQADFPLTPRPFAALAETLGCTEDEVIAALRDMQETGRISRVGAVIAPGRVGASTLAAMAVPADRLDSVAELVSSYDEVNHAYAREHDYNFWFVLTASSQDRLQAVLEEIEARTGRAVLDLPLEHAFHIDLGFRLQWN